MTVKIQNNFKNISSKMAKIQQLLLKDWLQKMVLMSAAKKLINSKTFLWILVSLWLASTGTPKINPLLAKKLFSKMNLFEMCTGPYINKSKHGEFTGLDEIGFQYIFDKKKIKYSLATIQILENLKGLAYAQRWCENWT